MECPRCSGEGYRLCDQCKGNGCDACGNLGTQICVDCEGEGIVEQ